MLLSFPALDRGVLLKRYKRFFADVRLDSGETVTAHCPNTGPMTGICTAGWPVLVSRSDNPKRKLAYTWEAIAVPSEAEGFESVWVGTNTNLPNRAIAKLLEKRLLPELGEYESVRSEVKYGQKSRIDFLLKTADEPPREKIYLEVKSTTWAKGSLALFPDTVTTRGQKHLREMMAVLPEARAAMVYFINRSDCDRFAPGTEADGEYGRLWHEAREKGVEMFACRFEVSPEGIRYLGLAEIVE